MNTIRALNRREFRQYCELLDLEYVELLHCEVRWLSRAYFGSEKNAVYNCSDEENELPDETTLLFVNSWLFDRAFLVDITSHLNDLNSKLNG